MKLILFSLLALQTLGQLLLPLNGASIFTHPQFFSFLWSRNLIPHAVQDAGQAASKNSTEVDAPCTQLVCKGYIKSPLRINLVQIKA